MSANITWAAIALGLAVGVSAGPTSASDTGLATSLHDSRIEGGRLCLADHSHSGQGSGSSRKQAEVSAIQAWASFTSFEYGSSWASFSNAAGKSIKCSGSGASWSCSLEARPCRSGGGGAPLRKVRRHVRG